MRTFIAVRRLIFICIISLPLFAKAQQAVNSDSLYEEFRKQLYSANSYDLKIIKTLRNSAATNKTAAFYLNLANADMYLNEGEKMKAFDCSKNALDIANELKCDSLIFRAHYKTGLVYMDLNDLIKALPQFNEALLLIKSVKNLNAKILLYKDIALLYSYLDKNEISIEYLLKVEPLIIESGNKKTLGNVYNNLAINYMDLKDSARALNYFTKSIAVRTEVRDSQGLAQVQNNLGTLYYTCGQYAKSLDYYMRGLEARRKAGNPYTGLIESKINIGKAYNKLNQADKAKAILEEARDEAVKIGHIETERRADEELLEIYNKLGEYKKAFELQTRYYIIKDSLYGLNKKEQISKLGFENKMREDSVKHAEIQRKASAVYDEKEKRTSLIRNIFIGGFVMVLVVAFLLYKQVKRIQLANKIIEEQKNEIEVKQKETMDSIRYARRIQQSLLPNEWIMEKNINKLKSQIKDKTV